MESKCMMLWKLSSMGDWRCKIREVTEYSSHSILKRYCCHFAFLAQESGFSGCSSIKCQS